MPDVRLQVHWLANAGHVAVGDSAVYYASFIRDEVVALYRAGVPSG